MGTIPELHDREGERTYLESSDENFSPDSNFHVGRIMNLNCFEIRCPINYNPAKVVITKYQFSNLALAFKNSQKLP